MNVSTIALRRLNKIVLPLSPTSLNAKNISANKSLVATFNLNLQALGYTLSPIAINHLLSLSSATALLIMDETIAALKEIKGVRNYKPMYPNFPQQVIDASAAELYINAMLHYFSYMLVDLSNNPENIWLPKYVKDQREPLDEKIEVRLLEVALAEDLDKLTYRLATSNTSLSATDKEDLRTLYLAGHSDFATIMSGITNKENLAYFGALNVGSLFDMAPYFKTATDVLRLATAMSGGDVSLSEDSKFKSFRRTERKYLVSLLETIKGKEEDMLRWRERWVRLGERLHPSEFTKRFPTTAQAFRALRNNEHIETFRSQVEHLLLNRSTNQTAIVLSQRPGEFARRLDHVLRTTELETTMTRVLDEFQNVAVEVSTPVLLQVLAHFENRNDMRVVFPKGNVAKVMSLEKSLPSLPESIVLRTVGIIKRALVERFSRLPSMGKVYIDPALKDCLVPFSQRSASKALRTLVRGSKLAMGEDKDTVRFFIWWKDMPLTENAWASRVDLDLSAITYGADWSNLGQVAFYNLREGYATHSGDITSAPEGASEFIDINIPKALKQGVRYVAMTVHGYTEQNFCDLPECFAGFMLREKAQSGEVYDPRTVVDKMDITMAARSGVPLILDLVERKIIWVDASITTNRYSYGNTANSSKGTVELLGKAFTSLHKPNLFDLFSLHAEARGTLVQNPEFADVVFSVEAGTPFEIDTIASEYMADAGKKTRAATV